MPRYGGRDPAKGGYGVSFAEHRQTAGETIVQWKITTMNASTKNCSSPPLMPTYAPLYKTKSEKRAAPQYTSTTNFHRQ